MNRAEKRKKFKEINVLNEVVSIIRSYFPELINMFNNLTDLRNQSYVTYQMKVIFMVRLLGLMCEIKSMHEMTSELNTEKAIRVTKKDGIIAIAYLTSDSIMIDWSLMGDHLINGYLNDFDDNFKMNRHPQGVFAPFYISEFKNIMSKFNVELLHNVATDGFTHHVKDKIDSLSKEEFEVWMRYHLSTCEREELQGYSNHMLYICKKN